LKTGYGGTLWAVSYAGIGQGNGAEPGIWAVMSTLVLKMTKEEGFGFIYKTSIEGKELNFVGYSFIENTDLIQSRKPGEETEILVCCMQAAMDTWEGG
jgi:hypothetical protein